MRNPEGLQLDYAARLAAVDSALAEAVAAGRVHDVESLRLAQNVLHQLIHEQPTVSPSTRG